MDEEISTQMKLRVIFGTGQVQEYDSLPPYNELDEIAGFDGWWRVEKVYYDVQEEPTDGE